MTRLALAEDVWIFQANPLRYRIIEMLKDKEVVNEFHWRVSRYRNDIRENSMGLIWLSGKNAGIYAITRVISNPDYYTETDAEKEYWFTEEKEPRTILRVKMKLIWNLSHHVTKDEIQAQDGLQKLSILKLPRGTNFKVTDEEWVFLKALIEGRQ